jgi:hypothetical protein
MRTHRASRLPRVPFGRAVSVTPDGDSEDAQHLQAVNLSLGGMFVQSDLLYPPGTHLSVALAAAGRMLNFAEGEVVWVKPPNGGTTGGFGLRFTQLPPRAEALVEYLIARGGTGQSAPRSIDRHPHENRWRRFALAVAVLGAIAIASVGLRVLAKPRALPPPAPTVAAPAMSLPPEPVPAPAPAPTPAVFPGEFQIAVPTGAVSNLRVTIKDTEVVLTPSLRKGATLKHVFTLPRPARLVIDVAGRQPKYSWQLDGAKVVKSVRVGARHRGTRVVVDLPEPLDPKMRFRVAPPDAI